VIELEYRKNANDVVRRRRAFFDGEMRDRILFAMPLLLKDYATLRRDGGEIDAPPPGTIVDAPPTIEDIYRKWDCALRGLAERPDDSLPLANVFRDYSNAMAIATTGRPIEYMTLRNGTASFAKKDDETVELDDLLDLQFDENSAMARRMRECVAYFQARCGGKFVLCPYIVNDGLHMLTLLRGYDRTYLDFYDQPEKLHEFLARAAEACIALHEYELSLIGPVDGGWTNKQANWYTQRVVTINLDDYLACCEDVYREFGLPYHQRIIDHFGRGILHYHTPALRLLPAVLELTNVIAVQVSRDPKLPKPIDTIAELRQAIGQVPMIDIHVNRDQFERMLRQQELAGNTEYVVFGVKDLDDARRLAELARTYVSRF